MNNCAKYQHHKQTNKFFYPIFTFYEGIKNEPLNGTVSRDFLPFFYFLNQSHLALDKQAKIVLLKNSFFLEIFAKNSTLRSVSLLESRTLRGVGLWAG